MIPSKIAFVGFAGSGKDYLAEYLVTVYNFKQVAFADSTKKFVHELIPQIKEYYSHEEKDAPLNIEIAGKMLTKTPREVWIDISTPILEVDTHFFLNRTKKSLLNQGLTPTIVTDVRRKVEFDFLMKEGYTIIYINAGKVCTNSFDEQILEFVDDVPFTFFNDFNGLEKFIKYINTFKKESQCS